MGTEPDRSTDALGLCGQTVAGRFLVHRVVAEGGFGVVYCAEQLALGRTVALKVFKAAGDGARFDAEARTIARLKHPNIVEVHDFGVSERAAGPPLPWMALEWLEGRTLEQVLTEVRAAGRPAIAPREALELLRSVLQAVAHAHRNGVVHRDLKPSNIFLVEEGGRRTLKVLDFGIASLSAVDDGAESGGGITTRSFAAFSPEYAAPEQVSYGRTGSWTDVHALGLVLTEMLTGGPPYPAGGAEERLAAVVSERRPTPGARGVDVGAWEPVLQQALARRPADRYPDAGALLSALEERVPAQSAAAAVAVAGSRTRRPRLLAALVAVVIAAGSWLAWRARQPTPPPGRVMLAVLPFENLTGDPQQEYFSDGLTDGMISHLGRLRPERLAVIARTSVVQYKQTKKSIREIGRELNVDYVLESTFKRAGSRARIDARLIKVGDQTQVWADGYEREIKDVLELQSEVARAIASGVQVKLTAERSNVLSRKRPLNPEAYDAYLKAKYFGAKKNPEGRRLTFAYLEKAIAIDPTYAAAHAALASAHFAGQMGAQTHPQEVVPKAKAAALRAIELDDQSAEAHVALAEILLGYEWDWAGAERHYQRALALDPNNADVHSQYRRWFQSLGRFPEAIAAAHRAIELAPLSAGANTGLVNSYYHSRQYDRALVQVQRALELDPAYSPALRLVSWLYADRGRYDEARAACVRANVSDLLLPYVLARAGRGRRRGSNSSASRRSVALAT